MTYTQRKTSVIFFICCIFIISTIFYLTQLQQKIVQSQFVTKAPSCLHSTSIFKQLHYSEPLHALFQEILTYEETPPLIQQLEAMPQYYTEDNLQKYRVYFLEQDTSEQLFQIENADCPFNQQSFFLLNQLSTKSMDNQRVFLDANFYYIRRDQSYICNEELTRKIPQGRCAEESYYIDLSFIL